GPEVTVEVGALQLRNGLPAVDVATDDAVVRPGGTLAARVLVVDDRVQAVFVEAIVHPRRQAFHQRPAVIAVELPVRLDRDLFPHVFAYVADVDVAGITIDAEFVGVADTDARDGRVAGARIVARADHGVTADVEAQQLAVQAIEIL